MMEQRQRRPATQAERVLRERAERLGYKYSRRGSNYDLKRPDGTGFGGTSLDGINEWLDAVEFKLPVQISSPCGTPLYKINETDTADSEAGMRVSKAATSFHEAAHAVIDRVLTLVCGGATIKPDDDSAGHSICQDPWACIYAWEKRGKVREPDAVWHARIIGFMAGAEAERELLGAEPLGDGDDRYQIDLMAEQLCANVSWDKLEPRLRAMTRMLARRHRALIERVAVALLDRTTLSAEELDQLVGRSVDDVTVNAPLLLEMHRAAEVDRGNEHDQRDDP